MAKNTKIPVVDYCKEAMETKLTELSTKDMDSIVYNLALLINGKIKTLDIAWNKVDEKTKVHQKIQIPAISFLRTDTIRKELKIIGIEESKVDAYLDGTLFKSDDSDKEEIKDKPLNLTELKKFIHNALIEKYGDSVLTKPYEKDIIVSTKTEKNGNTNVIVSLNYINQ